MHELYQDLVETSQDLIWQCDAEGRYTYLNPAWEQVFGYTVEEMLGRRFTDFQSPEVAQRDVGEFARLMKGNTVKGLETIHLGKAGNEIHLVFNAKFLTDEHGKPCGTRGTAYDITERKQVEHQLLLVQKAVESTREAIGISDENGRHVYQNRALSELFEYASAEELQAAGGGAAVIRDPAVAKEMFDRIQSGRSWAGELEMVTRSGRVIQAYERADGITDPRGHLMGLIGVITDISDRKRVEQAQRESEEKYRALFERSVHGILVTDIETSRFLYANPAICRMLGYTEAELQRLGISDLHPGDSLALVRSRFESLGRGEPPAAGTIQCRRKDGSCFEADVDGTSIVLGGRRCAVGFFTDVTRRNESEQALRESHERLVESQRIAKIGSWEANLRTGELFWSEAIFDIFGFDSTSFTPSVQAFRDAVHPEDLAKVNESEQRSVLSGRHDVTHRIVRPDGEVRVVHERARRQSDDRGDLIMLRGTVQDITDQVRAEDEKAAFERKLQQTQKLESLGVLAGGIAHDFNNLLTAIMGNASLALEDVPVGSPARGSIEEIERATHRATDLTRQMLAYAGKSRLATARIDLCVLVRDLAQMLRTVVAKKADLRLSLDGELPAIEGDPGQLRQVVMNLIINASEALGESVGAITVSTGVMTCDAAYLRGGVLDDELPPGPYVYLEVSDTGCGMDGATARRVFEPFFTTKFHGRGLGMSAVLGIVRTHRGMIQMRSALGCGTTFRVLFPALPAAHAQDDAEAPSTDPLALWRGRGKVLLVDDEEAVRSLGERILERLGFTVVTAADGRLALDLFKERGQEFALVLCDLTMPQLDGIETCQGLRALHPAVKIVMTSGYGEQDVLPRLAGANLAGFIQKPFQLNSLRAVLRKVLDGTGD